MCPAPAQVAELVDALVSGTSGASRGGSSPLLGTTKLPTVANPRAYVPSEGCACPSVLQGCATMLFRLVRPVRRKGSRVPYFVQRIPADLKQQIGGVRLAIPLGDSFHHVTLRAGSDAVRFSLRTTDPAEAKVRQAAVAAHLEKGWQALRERSPVSLTHRQATALAGELYRAWTNPPRGVVAQSRLSSRLRAAGGESQSRKPKRKLTGKPQSDI